MTRRPEQGPESPAPVAGESDVAGPEAPATGGHAGPVRRALTIVNERGLHARASARFVEMVERFDARARVSRDGHTVDGDSIMGLLTLAAACGTSIAVETRGREAEALMAALEALVSGGFGE